MIVGRTYLINKINKIGEDIDVEELIASIYSDSEVINGLYFTDWLFDEIKRMTGVNKEKMTLRNREQNVVQARWMFFWIMDKWTPLSSSNIGRYVCRDHSTVLYAKRIINQSVMSEKPFGYEGLKRRLMLIDDKCNRFLTIDKFTRRVELK